MPRLRVSAPNIPLLVTVVTWAFNFVAVKQLYLGMTPPAVSLVRFAIMYLVLLCICAVRKEPLKLPKQHRLSILVGGALAMGVYMVLFLQGMSTTSPAEGAIVLATSPVLTYLLACAVRQEQFTPLGLVGAIVAFAGVSVVVSGAMSSGHGSLVGNLLVLAASFVWALSVVVMRPGLAGMSPLQALTLSMPPALIVLVPYGIAATLHTDFTAVSAYSWLMMGHVAIMSGVVGFACFYAGVNQIGPAGASLYQYFVPPMTALFAWMVLGQPLTINQGVGLAVVLLGVSVATKARRAAALASASHTTGRG